MGSVTVGAANVILAGKEKTVTAPHAKTPASQNSAYAAAGVTVSVECVSVLSPVPTEPPVKNAPPVLIPAL